MRLALVASAHGFGHTTRLLSLAPRLREAGHRLSLFAPAMPFELPAGVDFVPWRVDVGIVQRDSVTEDLPATLPALEAVCSERRIDELARRLASFDRVIVDTAPAAMEAGRRAGVEVVALGSFDWAWIYGHYPELGAWAGRFAAWQAPHRAVEVRPGPGMHGFRRVDPFGLIGRSAPPVRVAPRSALLCFGGFGMRLGPLPDFGGTWVLAPPMEPIPGALHVRDLPFPALVAGADVLVTKPGYGVFTEAALAGTPIVWLHRPAFPEAPSLVAALEARGDEGVATLDPALLGPAILRALARPRPPPQPDEGAAVADALVLG